MKKRLQMILTLVLAVCCAACFLHAAAAEELQLIDAPVVTTDKTHITGRFLKEGGLVFVESETLKQMAPDINVKRTEDSFDFHISRKIPPAAGTDSSADWVEFFIPVDSARYVDGTVFVPFSTTMEWLRLNPVVIADPQLNADAGIVAATQAYEQGWMVVLEAGDVHKLGYLMEAIYTEPCYCMRYWKESKNYRRDVFLAEMVDAFRDLSLFSFVSGKTSYEGYCDAFAKLIKPQTEEEVDFSTGADEVLGIVSTAFSLGEDVGEFVLDLLNLDALSSLKGTFEVVDDVLDTFITVNETLNIEDQIELFAYSHAMRSAEETIIRGLKEIRTETPDVSDWMDSALTKVLDTYEESSPLWVQSLEKMSGQTFSSVKNLIMEFVPRSYLFDIGNNLTTFFFDTGNQLDATTNASRFLDIQTCCEQVFEEILPRYQEASREGKSRYLRILYDVTNVYLLAGIRAQEAMAQADGMAGVTGYCIKKLKAAQQQMEMFTEADILCYENCATAAHWLRSLQPLPRKTGRLAYYPTDESIFITIMWDHQVNGKPMDMTADITGVMDDGATLYHAPTEGEYTSDSGPVAVHSDNGIEIELEVFRHDGVLNVTAEYGDVFPFDAPSYEDANVEIWITDSQENIIAVIAANPDTSVYTDSPYIMDLEPFLLRGGAGVWYFSFQLDHGVLKSVFD